MTKFTHGQCTVQLSGGGFCDASSEQDMPFPICAEHAIRIWSRMTEHLETRGYDPLARVRLVNDLIDGFEGKRKAPEVRRSRVYYVQLGDCIKIGTTVRIKQRMAAYGPTSRLLATEFGDVDVERERHRQFAHLLEAGREWFRPGADLVTHINSLRKANGSSPMKTKA